MNIFELLQEPILIFPQARDKRSYESLLGNTFNDYIGLLDQLEDFEIKQEHSRKINARELKEKALKLAEAIIKALDEYGYGKPYEAFAVLKNILDTDRFLKMQIFLGGDDFFRVRKSNGRFTLSKEDLFHIPYHLKHNIRTQRYSIPGFPCLYLSDSVYTCWEEMKRPAIESLHVSRFRLNSSKPITVIEIPHVHEEIRKNVQGNQIIEGVIGSGIDSLLENWPLYFACSVPVGDPSVSYKVEYVIPQLLLQYVRQHHDIYGIKYFSTNVDHLNPHLDGTFNNYVFPVRSTCVDGYCSELSDLFELTEPVSQPLIDAAKGDTTYIYRKNEYNSSFVRRITLINGQSILYPRSVFGMIERTLSPMRSSPLPKTDSTEIN